MCGIFGCIGGKNLITTTINGLKVLEYRGYDSAGIAYLNKTQKITTKKSVGDIAKLEAKVKYRPATNICIGHTRWATNGGVCEKNSHPHLSANGQIAVVHNGIIKNYTACKSYLKEHRIELQTNVDTEVIPNILYLLQHNKHNIHNFLDGQYVFCACDTKANDTLFLAKKGSLPLHIGRSKDQIFITSDTLALPFTVTEIVSLDDLDTCEISHNTCVFHNSGKIVKKSWQPFTQSFTATDKNGFATFMQKEIYEIPSIINRIITAYQQNQNITTAIQKFHQLLSHTTCVHVCGCGTSYHAALIISALIEKHLGIRAKAQISSEFTAETILSTDDLAILISQSGETADTLQCLNILKAHRVPTISFCNVTSSTIATQSDLNFPLLCGPEIAVASTKVFCASILVGCLLLNKFSNKHLRGLSQLAQNVIQKATELIPLPDNNTQKVFFIGKGLDYFLSLESALKVKEVTYTHCEGYPASELKHGPLSLIDDKTLCIVYTSDTQNAVSEVHARGGKVIELPDPDENNPLSFITKIIPGQIFALNMAVKLGINPDKPRNLAKSVTVL